MLADERSAARARLAAAVAALACAAGLACAAAGAEQRAEAATPSGEAIFLRECATCHLGRGGLIGNAALPDLLAGPLPRGDDAAALTATIRNGTGSPKMPAFRDGLGDTEIAALVTWLREQRAQPPRAGDAGTEIFWRLRALPRGESDHDSR